ncbi:EamA-like transporter family protein [Posidoniimonas polymericola]|uniref:EamA-like transporter family protein n=1 Tax=Posidoniimonas polymericola TaxID=2528002 RepID=A0A5C5YSK5_9BACT|nr:EamA family transporter [Posidoniimonas polymericola]TWT77856.1 EamA-like transporter family protein [Posidoniimonas polymericola]
MPYLIFGLIALVFGSNFILMKLASSAFSPAAIGSARLLGGAVMLAIIWLLVSKRERLTRRQLVTAAVIGLVANAYPYAMQPGLISLGVEHSFLGMMVAFTPMSIMLFSIPVLGVWPSARQLIGVVGGFVFLSVLMLDGHFRGYSFGLLALAISVPLSYGLANAYLKKKLHKAPPLPATAAMLAASGVVLLPLVAAGPTIGLAGPAEPTDYPRAIAALAMLGPVGTGLMMWLWVRLVNTQGPLFAGMVTYVVPLVAMMWGAFDGERITVSQLVSIAGVLSMVALVQYRAAAKPAGDHAPTEPAPSACERELACADASR